MNNKFLFFKTQEGFLKKCKEIPDTSIVFIKDKGLIWTHKQYFGLSTGLEKAKGYFDTLQELITKYPNPEIGDWAIIARAIVDGEEKQWVVARCIIKGQWALTAQTYDRESFDLNEYVKKEDLDLSRFITEADILTLINQNINLNLYATREELYRALQLAINGVTIPIDSQLSTTSLNPVQNKAISIELLKKLEESDLQGYIKAEDISDLIAIDADEIWSAIRQKAGVSDVSAIQSRLDTYDQVVLPNKVDRDELVNYALKSEFETEVNTYVTEIIRVAEKAKGYYDSYADLIQAVSNPEIGDWAVISSNGRWVICKCSTNGVWTETSQEYAEEAPDLNAYAKKSDLDSYTPLSNFNQYVSTFNLHVSTASTLYATKSELIAGLDSNRQYTNDNLYDAKVELQNLINSLTAQLNVIKEKYISWYGSQEGSHDGDLEPVPTYNSNMVTLSEVQYQALVQAGKVDPDTYYFTYNAADYPTTWTFGNKFPITFTEQWAFGGTFPITLR